MKISLHNSASGRIEELVPADPSRVTMYVCGPTVYGMPHIGNARPLVVFDLLFRLLKLVHGDVAYARNITDIDDKIIAAAADASEEPAALAERFTRRFHTAAKQLGCLAPTHEPRATEHIGGMLKLVATLLRNGHAYATRGHVLFDVSSYPRYGELANRSREGMLDGARVEVADYKRNPGDFVLWKPSEPNHPGWNSKHGRGRPGWHLECSAMIHDCLGETVDIHGGGADLLFPHHENESAQSCCALGTGLLARHWVHNGHVMLGGRKMAKSAGILASLDEALGAMRPEVVRYALLATHYHKPLEWSKGALEQSSAVLTKLYRLLEAVGGEGGEPPPEFVAALADDLNTPLAISLLHRYAAEAVDSTSPDSSAEAAAKLRGAGRLMGILSANPADWLRGKDTILMPEDQIRGLVEARNRARAAGDYAKADRLRGRLGEAGLVLEDGAQGTVWRTK